MNRREFLYSSSLSALALTGYASPRETQSRYIDAHVHVWTPDTDRYPLAEGFTREKSMIPRSFTPQELLSHCRPEGVARIVLIQMSFYKLDNRYMLDVMESQPGTFSGVAIVDETKSDLVPTMRELAKRGVRGFRVRADLKLAESWRDSDGMKKMWSVAADEGLSICLLADPDALSAIQLMREKYPKTRVVIDHFARIGMQGVIQPDQVEALKRLSSFEHTFVKTSAFYALGRKAAPYEDMAPLIRTLKDAYGSNRLMWASDCPYQVENGHTYHDSIALVRDRLPFLTAEDKEWMLRKTAEHVFFS
jgi:predicted TIM-barrel fold metal-dependent hydrolase